MANLTQKEKALKIIAKQIKVLDNNILALEALNCPIYIGQARNNFFEILEIHGYQLECDYKLIKNQE